MRQDTIGRRIGITTGGIVGVASRAHRRLNSVSPATAFQWIEHQTRCRRVRVICGLELLWAYAIWSGSIARVRGYIRMKKVPDHALVLRIALRGHGFEEIDAFLAERDC